MGGRMTISYPVNTEQAGELKRSPTLATLVSNINTLYLNKIHSILLVGSF